MPPKRSRSTAARKTASARGRAAGRSAARWTDQQVKLLRDTVADSRTAKEAFQIVAEQLGKSPGTVQQKWYAMQRAAGKGSARGGARRPGRPAGSRSTASASGGSARDLRSMPVDELVSLARSVREEIDRRRRELDAAQKLFG